MHCWKILSTLALMQVVGCGSRARFEADLGPPDRDMTIPWGDEDLTVIPTGPVDMRGEYNADAACATANATAQPAKRPVDLIVVIDNSGSMQDEIRAVQKNINNSLAEILRQSGLDYRVIMISSFGPVEQTMVCIGPPLSNNDCDRRPLGGPPKNGERYFQYDYPIATNDSFQKLLDTYRKPDRWGLSGGWSTYLRPGSLRMFVEISDDRSDMSEKDFNFRLFVMDPTFFADPKGQKPAFVWHSIVGLKENMPATKPWGPMDPYQMRACSNNVWSAGDEFQNESILTGGYRFPICEFMSFDTIFKLFAQVIIEGAKLDCEIVIPDPPDPMQVIDLPTVLVEFTSSRPLSQPEHFNQVKNKDSCGAGALNFYIKPGDKSIALCPDTCNYVQQDLSAKMKLLYNCVELK